MKNEHRRNTKSQVKLSMRETLRYTMLRVFRVFSICKVFKRLHVYTLIATYEVLIMEMTSFNKLFVR